jgi:hypothetical protein
MWVALVGLQGVSKYRLLGLGAYGDGESGAYFLHLLPLLEVGYEEGDLDFLPRIGSWQV